MEMLYTLIANLSMGHLRRQGLWAESEDHLHDAYVAVLDAILHDRVRQPDCLPGFIAVVVRRMIYSDIKGRITARQRLVPLSDAEMELPDSAPSPESDMLTGEEREVALRRLARLKPTDREILTRFCLEEQDPVQICAEMGISESQFRCRKWRAMARIACRRIGIS
ncbi:MAG: sigma-70 family RNA polymerase sigma factor [Acidobacteriales bacterium]|nr:sigma-70 family RNA polymerase sigma factor [Terriglobales bacterium]